MSAWSGGLKVAYPAATAFDPNGFITLKMKCSPALACHQARTLRPEHAKESNPTEPARGFGLQTALRKGAAEATPMTFQGRDGKQYVVITSTGGGFFNNPITDDSITAFALEDSK